MPIKDSEDWQHLESFLLFVALIFLIGLILKGWG
jgi:hypothetical protein